MSRVRHLGLDPPQKKSTTIALSTPKGGHLHHLSVTRYFAQDGIPRRSGSVATCFLSTLKTSTWQRLRSHITLLWTFAALFSCTGKTGETKMPEGKEQSDVASALALRCTLFASTCGRLQCLSGPLSSDNRDHCHRKHYCRTLPKVGERNRKNHQQAINKVQMQQQRKCHRMGVTCGWSQSNGPPCESRCTHCVSCRLPLVGFLFGGISGGNAPTGCMQGVHNAEPALVVWVGGGGEGHWHPGSKGCIGGIIPLYSSCVPFLHLSETSWTI